MRNIEWIRRLVDSERRMEETGMIDLAGTEEDSQRLTHMTQDFLREIKEQFVEYATAFNNLKNTPMGSVKIYGISNTPADFMLFRNGYKLLFTAVAPGRIAINLHSQAPQLARGAQSNGMASNDGTIEAVFGAFGDISWTYNGSKVNPEALVRYYLSRFVRESAK